MDEEFYEFIDSTIAKNTKYGNTCAFNTFTRYLHSIEERRDILSIPPKELDSLIAKFFIHAKKLDGNEVEPNSLSTSNNTPCVTTIFRQFEVWL